MIKKLIFFTALFTHSIAFAQDTAMKITIELPNQQKITATLVDNQTARDFYAQLPLTMALEDYANSEKIGTDIPKRLNIADSPKGYEGKKGDLTYYAPWGNLAIFYKNSNVCYANGLVYFGKVDGNGIEKLQNLNGEKVRITK